MRENLVGMRFSLVDQTKMVTAASELARNILRYGGGGHCLMTESCDEGRSGLLLTSVNQSSGLADVSLALTVTYLPASGMRVGLSGAERLADFF